MNGLYLNARGRRKLGNNRESVLERRMTHIDLKQNIEEVEQQITNSDCDYIFIGYSDYLKQLKPLCRKGVPVLLGTGDPWGRLFTNELRILAEKHHIDGIVTDCKCTQQPYKEYLGKPNINTFLLRWGVDTSIMKDYKEDKVWDIIQSGKFSTYSYRRELNHILTIMTNRKQLDYHRFPPSQKTGISYEQYAINLNKSWLGIGGCIQNINQAYYNNQFIGYTYRKTIEVPACKTCLVNSVFGDAEDLGFVDGYNCILFTDLKDAINKIKKYLKDKNQILKMTERSYKLVHDNYDAEMVVDDFIKQVERVYE